MKFYFTTTTDSLPELQDIPQSLSRLELQYEMQQRSAWPGAHNLSPAEGSSEGFSVAASFTWSSPALRHPDQSGFLSKSLLLIITMFYYRYFQLEYFCSIFYLQTCPGSIQPVCLPKDISQIGLHKVQIIVLFCSGQNNIRPTKNREGKIKKSKDRNTFSTQFCSIAPWMVIFYGEISPDSL